MHIKQRSLSSSNGIFNNGTKKSSKKIAVHVIKLALVSPTPLLEAQEAGQCQWRGQGRYTC